MDSVDEWMDGWRGRGIEVVFDLCSYCPIDLLTNWWIDAYVHLLM